jgi:predicted nucleic acid-binding protein
MQLEDFAGEAKQLLGEHIKDIPYFALSLYLNCGIWSNEKRFKRQSRIKAVSTNLFLERKALPKETHSFLAQVLSAKHF